jgi:hypothetical protein
MKKLSTKKLFFNQWTFKIEMKVKGASLIKKNGVEWVKKFCTDESFYTKKHDTPFWRGINKINLYKFLTAIEPHLEKDIKIRTEDAIFNVYTSDKAIVDSILNDLDWCVTAVHEPNDITELEFLKNNPYKIICDELPYGKYTHKVSFNERTPKPARLKFWQWISKYDEDTVKIGRATVGFLDGTKFYTVTPFLYVTNAKFLTMISLQIGEHVRRIEEFVPRSTLLL